MAAPATTRKEFGTVEIDRGLTALILAGGNAEQAARDTGFHGRTIRKWKDAHPGRYVELQQELAPRIADRIASEAEQLAVLYAKAEREALEVAMGKIHELDADKAASAVRNFATAKALQVDKISSPLRGRPTVITEHRAGDELLRGLASRVGMTIDGTAEELPMETGAIEAPV